MKNTRFEENQFWLGEVIETLMYFKILSNDLGCIGFMFTEKTQVADVSIFRDFLWVI